MGQRSGFDGVFVDTDGTPLVNISASILDGDNNPVTVYAAKTGAAEQAQPITTTSALPGLVKFWAEPGFYQVEITDNEIPERFGSRKIPFDAVAGDTTSGSEGISVSQLDLADEITDSMLKTNSVTTNKIVDDAVTSPKLGLTYGATKLNANLSFSSTSAWDTVLSLSGLGSGLVLVIASFYCGGANDFDFALFEGTSTNKQQVSVTAWTETAVAGGDSHYHTVNPIAGSLAYIWETSGTVTLRAQGGGGKDEIGAGTSLVAVRIG